jgi:hypothetical protein
VRAPLIDASIGCALSSTAAHVRGPDDKLPRVPPLLQPGIPTVSAFGWYWTRSGRAFSESRSRSARLKAIFALRTTSSFAAACADQIDSYGEKAAIS